MATLRGGAGLLELQSGEIIDGRAGRGLGVFSRFSISAPRRSASPKRSNTTIASFVVGRATQSCSRSA